jgi:hypothetical protein
VGFPADVYSVQALQAQPEAIPHKGRLDVSEEKYLVKISQNLLLENIFLWVDRASKMT